MATAVGSILTVDEGRAEQMKAALWDLALGHAVLLPYGAKPPQGVWVEKVSVFDENGDPAEIKVYITPPDATMLKHLIEQNVGRPGSRLAKEQEQVITVMHAIPTWDAEDDTEFKGAAEDLGEADWYEEPVR